MSDRYCLFCKHFGWTKESMWGMGSSMTGPMMEGGDAVCAKDVFHTYPSDEGEWREVIAHAKDCEHFELHPDCTKRDAP